MDGVDGIHGMDRRYEYQHGMDWRLGRDRMVWIYGSIRVDRVDGRDWVDGRYGLYGLDR